MCIYIHIANFIDYYKTHISTMILDNAARLKNRCVYILLADKDCDIFKFGKTEDLRKRLRTYATGARKHPNIQFIMLVNNKDSVETCVKNLAIDYQYKENQELYKIDINKLNDFIYDCAELHEKYNEIPQHGNSDAYVVFDSTPDDEIEELARTLPKIRKSKKSKK